MHFRIRIAIRVFFNCYKCYFNQSNYDLYAEIQNSDIEILTKVAYGIYFSYYGVEKYTFPQKKY